MKNSYYKYGRVTLILAVSILLSICISCTNENNSPKTPEEVTYTDNAFIQEYHEAFPLDETQVNDISVDQISNIWIATNKGVYFKKSDSKEWQPISGDAESGPAYSIQVLNNGDILMGTWNGLYRFSQNQLTQEKMVEAPVSVICSDNETTYALGPNGIWMKDTSSWIRQNYEVARSVRDAKIDADGTLWVANDAGLYACKNGETTLYQNTDELYSCYAKAISHGPDSRLWIGVTGGVSIRKDGELLKNLTPEDGIPSINVNCIQQSPDRVMWVGTDMGVVRFYNDGSHSLRFSKRWLTDNKVNNIDFDKEGNAWIATDNGVSAIKRKEMTLAEKQAYFYGECMNKHIREPWICGNLRLSVPGDTSTWQNSDDDNDGEYTGGYLVMESFRYAATGDEDARLKARKAFDFLCYLQTVTETEGFFARTIVPADWTEVHDPNRTYSEQQKADALVRDPRYKAVETRWHKSSDGEWLWKGDTSSDEMVGHMMAYFYYYEFAAGEEEKQLIREHVSKIIDVLIKNNYNLIDIDGKHTRWGVWSPGQLNRNPDWASEKSLNSIELLAFLKFASHITGNQTYENEYLRLIKEEGYLENAKGINSKNPAWQIYFDLTMEGYLFPIFFRYETNPEFIAVYQQILEDWMAHQKDGENLLNNLSYALCTGNKVHIKQTINFLKDTPLDLVDWRIDHTLREDVQIVRSPILEEIQISELPPASERATVRWDKNPWAAIHGNPSQVREPVFWLWPYWEARYLGIINN